MTLQELSDSIFGPTTATASVVPGSGIVPVGATASKPSASSSTTTDSTGILDSLFGVAEKGLGLWTSINNAKNANTAEQLRLGSVTDATRLPATDSGFTINQKTLVVLGGALVVGGLALYLVTRRK